MSENLLKVGIVYVLANIFNFEVDDLLGVLFVAWLVYEATIFLELPILELLILSVVMGVFSITWADDVLEEKGVNKLLESFGPAKDFLTFSLSKLCLCFLEEIFDDVGDIVSVVANFCVFCGFDVDERRIVDL